jgi:hypothetical protein
MATSACLVISLRLLLMLCRPKHQLLLDVTTLLHPLFWALVRQDQAQVLWALALVD